MKFNELKFEEVERRGIQAWATFRNGFEVSVVKHQFSYGGEKGLYEMGVFDNQRTGMNAMCDPLDWGDTVKGWLAPEDVDKELELLEAL